MVRGLVLAALLSSSLCLVPTAAAQGGPVHLLADASGDVQILVAGTQPVPDVAGAYACADLVGLDLLETRSDLTFTLSVGDLKEASQDPAADGCRYQVTFTHNGREFQLGVFRTLPALSSVPFTTLDYRDSPGDEWSRAWSSIQDAVADLAADTLTVAIARDLLADADGAAPFPGRTLDGIQVLGASGLGGGSISFGDPVPAPSIPWPATAVDRMPDDPSLASSFAFLLGVAQTRHARLASSTPFRASNGEATTFVYEVTAHNLGEATDRFELEPVGVPAGFTAVVPTPVLALEPGSNATVPVLLTIPFGHQHGAMASFTLEMRSLSDAGSVGRLEMGVRFLAIPQPAGHHDDVFLHTSAPSGSVPGAPGLFGPIGYLNTLEDDPNDQGLKDCTVGFSMAEPGTWHVSWPYRLQPTLLLGLDVDAAKVGHLKVPISTTLPALEARLFASLYLEVPGETMFDVELVRLAGMDWTAARDLAGTGATALFEGDILPEETAPRLAYQPGTNLVLWLTLTFKGPNSLGVAGEGACVMPGGSATLPLEEWHDPVDEVLAALDGPGLSPLGPQERLVNPGEAVVFPVSIANPLDGDARIELEVSGPNAAWATLASPSVLVPAHATAQASLVVRAPAGATDGERADLVLQAYARDDPTARGLLRLVAEVDTDAEHPDDTAAAAELAPKKSPSPGVVAAASLLALLAIGLRRRR